MWPTRPSSHLSLGLPLNNFHAEPHGRQISKHAHRLAIKNPAHKSSKPFTTNGQRESHIAACPNPIKIISIEIFEKALAITFSFSNENSAAISGDSLKAKLPLIS